MAVTYSRAPGEGCARHCGCGSSQVHATALLVMACPFGSSTSLTKQPVASNMMMQLHRVKQPPPHEPMRSCDGEAEGEYKGEYEGEYKGEYKGEGEYEGEYKGEGGGW